MHKIYDFLVCINQLPGSLPLALRRQHNKRAMPVEYKIVKAFMFFLPNAQSIIISIDGQRRERYIRLRYLSLRKL
ncbi:hypothetical protein HZS_6036 [Henneguya salminicola]|nr:hypothetical protein HZS_6036 [Henneguya salminicola]